MPNTNAGTQCSALGRQAAILGWLQIPVEKRQALHNRIAKRQQQSPTKQPGASA